MMLEEYDEDKMTTVVTLARSIWTNRNEVCHSGTKKMSEALVKWSAQYLAEYRNANSPSKLVPRNPTVRWSPPPTARYKLNLVGAVFKEQKSAGIGVLIRDE